MIDSKPIEEVVSDWIEGFGRIRFTPKRRFSPVSSIVNINSGSGLERNVGNFVIGKPDGWNIEGDVDYRVRFNGPVVITEMELRSPPDKRAMVSLYVGGNSAAKDMLRHWVVPAGDAMAVGPGLEIRSDQWLGIRTDWSLSGSVRYRKSASCGSDQIEHPLAHPPEPAEVVEPFDDCGIMKIEPIEMANDTDLLWRPQWRAKGAGFVNAKTRRNMICSRDLQRMVSGEHVGTKLYLDSITVNNESDREKVVRIHTPYGGMCFAVSAHSSGTQYVGDPVDTSRDFILDMPSETEVEVAFRAGWLPIGGRGHSGGLRWSGTPRRTDDATVVRNFVAWSFGGRGKDVLPGESGNMTLDRIVFRPADTEFVASVDVRKPDGSIHSSYGFSLHGRRPHPSGLLGEYDFSPGWNIGYGRRVHINIKEGHGQVLLFAHDEQDCDSPEKKIYLERKPERIINKEFGHLIGEIVSAGRATVAVRHNGNRRSSDMTYTDLARKYEWVTTVDPVKLLE